MRDLYNVIPEPLNRNSTMNVFYSYAYLTTYISKFNSNENNTYNKLSISYYANSDFSGQESSYILSMYNCNIIKKIPKPTYKLNTDFYIPGAGELSMAFEKIGRINNVLSGINKKKIDLDKTFFSSTLYNEYNVWTFNSEFDKLSYVDISERKYVLPFFRYIQTREDIESLGADDIMNSLEENFIISLPDNAKFSEYIYYTCSGSINAHYPINKNSKTFVGYPTYKNNNNDLKNLTKKTKLKFYIVIPRISDFQIKKPKADEDGYEYIDVTNPFIKKYNQIKGSNLTKFEKNNFIITLYTFDNYLDIFNMNYKESFTLEQESNTVWAKIDEKDIVANIQLDANGFYMVFKFNHEGFFNNDNCLAICFEVKYYDPNNINQYVTLFRDFYFFYNYNILLSFPYTNKIKLRYYTYYSQLYDDYGALINSKISRGEKNNNGNYVSLNNYKLNNKKFKYYLTNFPMTVQENVFSSEISQDYDPNSISEFVSGAPSPSAAPIIEYDEETINYNNFYFQAFKENNNNIDKINIICEGKITISSNVTDGNKVRIYSIDEISNNYLSNLMATINAINNNDNNYYYFKYNNKQMYNDQNKWDENNLIYEIYDDHNNPTHIHLMLYNEQSIDNSAQYPNDEYIPEKYNFEIFSNEYDNEPVCNGILKIIFNKYGGLSFYYNNGQQYFLVKLIEITQNIDENAGFAIENEYWVIGNNVNTNTDLELFKYDENSDPQPINSVNPGINYKIILTSIDELPDEEEITDDKIIWKNISKIYPIAFNLSFDVPIENENTENENTEEENTEEVNTEEVNNNINILPNPLDELKNYYINESNDPNDPNFNLLDFHYCIRTYFDIDNIYGIFGNIYDHQDNDINKYDYIETNMSEVYTIQYNKKSKEFVKYISFSATGVQQDILFINNEQLNEYVNYIDSTNENIIHIKVLSLIKKIEILNHTNDHINIWIEDESKKLCVKKVRLCIPPKGMFITYASKLIESYYIKVEIESYNEYMFTNNTLNIPFMNICVTNSDNSSDDIRLEINYRQ